MLLFQFAGLQILDAATTLWFLHRGVAEANPLIAWALVWGAQPFWGLAAAKALGFAPAVWAWRSGRHGLLRRVNLLFAVCVAWNLAAVWLVPGPR